MSPFFLGDDALIPSKLRTDAGEVEKKSKIKWGRGCAKMLPFFSLSIRCDQPVPTAGVPRHGPRLVTFISPPCTLYVPQQSYPLSPGPVLPRAYTSKKN